MWYAIEALFKCETVTEQPDEPLYEKTIFLTQADDNQAAEQKARQVVKQREVTYKNEAQEDVVWRFVKLLDVQELEAETLHDGVEVFSRLMWESELKSPS